MGRIQAGRASKPSAAKSAKTPHQVAHARELEHLVRCYETYQSSGRPGTVLVVHGPQAHTVGELVKDWRRELMRRSETVFEASCAGGRTYRPLRDLVSAYYGFLDEIGLMSDTLQSLFGELSDTLGLSTFGQTQFVDAGPRPGQIYFHFYYVLGRFFVEASNLRPAGLIIRDLHLADSATLAAVTYLAKNFALDPIDAFIPEGVDRDGFKGMLVLTLESGNSKAASPPQAKRHRSGQPPGDVLVGLRRGVADRPHAEFIDLVGVDEEAVRQYLQRPEVVERFLASTGGRPENLDAVVAMLPSSSEELLLARLEALDGPAREMLELLSVYNRPMSPDALVQLTDGGERAAAEAIGALLEQRLLARRVGRGKLRVEFAHEDAGRLVYTALDPERRREVHREIAQMLEHQHAHGQGVDLEEIAYHYMRSDDRMRAVHYGLEAVEKLHRAYAYQPARELLEEALGLVGDGPERSDVVERLVETCSALNEHHDALKFCEELAELQSSPKQRVTIQRRMGKILLDMGRYDRAVEELREAEGALSAGGDLPEVEELVQILSHMAEGLCGQGAYDEAVSVCERGLSLVERAGKAASLPRMEVDLTNTLGKVCLFREAYAEAEAYFESGREQALAGGWPDAEARALFNLGTIAVQQRRYEDAESIFQKCLS
ncbi:MAG: tetratricopeptide repeat protein, partial [Myxococcota bacterium]